MQSQMSQILKLKFFEIRQFDLVKILFLIVPTKYRLENYVDRRLQETLRAKIQKRIDVRPNEMGMILLVGRFWMNGSDSHRRKTNVQSSFA